MELQCSQELLDNHQKIFTSKGHRVVRTPSSLWINVKTRIYQAMPSFNLSANLSREAHLVFHHTKAVACRYFTPQRHQPETPDPRRDITFVYLLSPPYDLSKIRQKARNQTRRGMERVKVKREEFREELLPSLYRVYRDNVLRLRLTRSESRVKEWWLKWTRVLKEVPNTELWCSWRNEELAAFLVLAWSPHVAEILLQRSLAQALRFYPNNAMVYTVAQDVFERGTPLLSYGLSILTNPKGGLHHFKVNMGFQALALKLNYRWHPLLHPLLSRIPPEKLHGTSSFIKNILGLRH